MVEKSSEGMDGFLLSFIQFDLICSMKEIARRQNEFNQSRVEISEKRWHFGATSKEHTLLQLLQIILVLKE